MPAADPDEPVQLVDEDDDPAGTAPRSRVHEEALLHRAVHVLLVDEGGRLVLQRRSQAKRTYPGRLTSSASGHVDAGEDPDEAARRELAEELGVEADLDHAGILRVEDLDAGEREIVHAYTGTLPEGVRVDPDPDEVREVLHAPLAEVRAWVEDEDPVLADSFRPVYVYVEDRIAALAEAR
jgi:16S rRNA (adenine1518-N6/adenine1519-N6)-dimethyltransferase